MQVENLRVAKSGAEPEQMDPVCGMTVDPASAAGSHQHGGKTYFFCNPSCLEKFKAKPDKFLGGAIDEGVPAAGSSEVEYVCPMDPEIHQRGPGSCPKCGMALEPAMYTPPPTRTEYTCPMHPEIVRSDSGACPICGMALEPREITGEEVNHELIDMTRRFWASLAFTVPLLALMVSEFFPAMPLQNLLGASLVSWIQFAMSAPVVVWAGWPFFERGSPLSTTVWACR